MNLTSHIHNLVTLLRRQMSGRSAFFGAQKSAGDLGNLFQSTIPDNNTQRLDMSSSYAVCERSEAPPGIILGSSACDFWDGRTVTVS